MTRPRTGAEPLVRARDVSHVFGDGGVRELDLEVLRRSIFGLVGPSGSGKTTTVQLLLGLIAPDSGELSVLGEEPVDMPRRDRARIGYMPQESVLYPELTLAHNLNFVASLYEMPWRPRRLPKTEDGKKARKRVEEVLELLDLEDRSRHRVSDLSGGEKRRLALATALVHDPELLILDEPTTGIDPVLRQDLWRHFGRLRDDGRTIIVTTQYVTEAAYCDLVALLVDGRVLTVGTPEELREEAFGASMLAFEFDRPLSEDETDDVRSFEPITSVSRGAKPSTLRAGTSDRSEARHLVGSWADRNRVRLLDVSDTEPSFDEVFVELVERHRNGEQEPSR